MGNALDSTLIAALRGRRSTLLRGLGPLAVLIALVAISAAIAPGVVEVDSLVSFLSDAAPIIALVIGGTLPILAGSIDLSVAGVASLTGVLVVVLNPIFGPWTSVVVILIAMAFGATQGLLHSWLQLPSFIVTLGTLSMLSGLALLLSNATAEPIPDNDLFVTYLSDSTADIPNTVIALIIIIAVLGLMLRYLRLGRDIYALGTGERAAIMSAVNVVAVRTIIFAISAGCAAIAGLFLISITAFSSPTLAGNLLLLSIVGVVLGGTAISGGVGGLLPAVVGGLITSWLRIVTVIIGVQPTAQNIVFGLTALVAVALTTDRSKLGIIK
ncbi:ABC transporter permease [Rhizobium sp. SG570]|jgi:ribose transport system permease protein|uniref:ABC transporter permease n=1 Tax=unclassified Rhizobium TaxID=2613769 RepID=UPI001445D4FC|nr:ABC transporter permease [Rhizobium sp. SG570]NKJ37503.1 ribose transport system permease protein [Rhizobium sp. SG570]